MNITISLNKEAREFYEEDPKKEGYMGSIFLTKTFKARGHDVKIVHPDDIFKKEDKILAKKVFDFDEKKRFRIIERYIPLKGDVFFVYSLGEDNDNPDVSLRFMNSLYQLENQFSLVLNSAESTSYESKDKQKTLNLPFIPQLDIRNKRDLIKFLKSEKKIIAKPKVGFLGKGVSYLEKLSDSELIPEERLGLYVYEEFVPETEERRYIFLDKELIIVRRAEKEGPPGKENFVSINLGGGRENEKQIARKAINLTRMFYGAVDFRGDYLLEINGSGTGVAPPTIKTQPDPYNLSGVIVQAVEKKLKNHQDLLSKFLKRD